MNLLALPHTLGKTSEGTHPSEIEHKTQDALSRSGYLALRDVSCVSSEGVIFLHGRVPSFYLKQVAQEIAFGAEGVRRVINRIEVLSRHTGPPSSRSGQDSGE